MISRGKATQTLIGPQSTHVTPSRNVGCFKTVPNRIQLSGLGLSEIFKYAAFVPTCMDFFNLIQFSRGTKWIIQGNEATKKDILPAEDFLLASE